MCQASECPWPLSKFPSHIASLISRTQHYQPIFFHTCFQVRNDRRVINFYPSARLDGLVCREELQGRKMVERYAWTHSGRISILDLPHIMLHTLLTVPTLKGSPTVTTASCTARRRTSRRTRHMARMTRSECEVSSEWEVWTEKFRFRSHMEYSLASPWILELWASTPRL